ncbi:DUF4124 domain-containing protein [Geomonas edaphica]|uniref:DUF4124 domain-containing protein n=1 Tax=Geomonas edaphica TaxID=2570226 RepID=UPI0010A83741|nr:DUF4124 domain-containing protein [Geomonas edaphica]
MRTFIKLALIFAAALPCLASAATYQWRDDAGVLHFTDDSDRIPERYLKRVTETDSGAVGKGAAPAPKKQEAPAAPDASGSVAKTVAQPAEAKRRVMLEEELKRLKGALPLKKEELSRLQHKWMVSKGRTPTAKEIAEFEKKRAKGKVTYADNPYVNKSPLSSTIPARVAYRNKLEEVQKDEARVAQLEQELQALK